MTLGKDEPTIRKDEKISFLGPVAYMLRQEIQRILI